MKIEYIGLLIIAIVVAIDLIRRRVNKTSKSTDVESYDFTKPAKKKVKPIWVLVPAVLLIIVAGIGTYFYLQPDFKKEDTIVVDGFRKTKSDLKPITGVVEGVGPFKNGLKNGYFKELNQEGKYELGVKSGIWAYYHTNELKTPKEKVNYLNGKKDGPYKEWNNIGILIAEGTYDQGMEIGLNKTWTNKGVLNKVVDYKADRLTLYNGDGKKIYDGSLKEWQYEKEREELARKEADRKRKEAGIIFEQNGHGIIAARKDLGRMGWHEAKTACADLFLNGFSNWRLPTKIELNMMYLQKYTIGGFANAYYWSSSEGGSANAWGQAFSNGAQFFNASHTDTYRVRAVRDF